MCTTKNLDDKGRVSGIEGIQKQKKYLNNRETNYLKNKQLQH